MKFSRFYKDMCEVLRFCFHLIKRSDRYLVKVGNKRFLLGMFIEQMTLAERGSGGEKAGLHIANGCSIRVRSIVFCLLMF